MEKSKPKVYVAAIKYLERQQRTVAVSLAKSENVNTPLFAVAISRESPALVPLVIYSFAPTISSLKIAFASVRVERAELEVTVPLRV
ncbi:hypothetical protein ES703_90694 [subsurface metagenome]